MRVSYYPDVDLPDGARPCVTLGNFDGVHRGHQRAIELLKTRAKEASAPCVALTFEPHPVSVLRPEHAPRRILTPELKQEVLASLGFNLLVVIHFTREFSRFSAESFVDEVLVGSLRASELVLGSNFRFGRGRSGDLESLRSLGEGRRFIVHEVEATIHKGEMISSSRIRRSLEAGRVDEAREMLGRPYLFDGRIVEGDGRGRLMGFPTANVNVEGDVLVADGVYVTEARIGGERLQGMTHVGRRPTFGLDERMVETHLFDFSREVYGEPIRLYFHQRVRGTVAFESADVLKRQLERDRDEARHFFDEPGGNLLL